MTKRIVLADPRGFCAGVDRAILTVQTILKASVPVRKDGLPPVYVRRQIVHNKHVVEELSAQGAVFVQELRYLLCHVESSGRGQVGGRAIGLRGDRRVGEFLEFRTIDGGRAGRPELALRSGCRC